MRYIMVTGSRHATFHHYQPIIGEALAREAGLQEWTLVHGKARGVDRIASIVSDDLGNPPLHIHAFPADWDAYGQAAGPIRNEKMTAFIANRVKEGNEAICLAFHHDWQHGSGTNNAIEYAESAGIPVTRITVNQPITLPKKRPLVKL